MLKYKKLRDFSDNENDKTVGFTKCKFQKEILDKQLYSLLKKKTRHSSLIHYHF